MVTYLLLENGYQLGKGRAALLKLREARVRKLLSVAELAKRSGLAYKTVEHVEKGTVTPTLATARKLCGVLEMGPEDIDELRAVVDRELSK